MNSTSFLTCQAILFDLDGTLVDSSQRLLRLWKWWAELRGFSYEELVATMYGRRANETLALLAPELNLQSEIDMLEDEEVADMSDITAYPGALALLNRLAGRRWAIVTSGARRVAEARLRHTQLPIPQVFVTADMIEHGKPAPDGYLMAARLLGVQPQDCVVIEDSPVGIQSGKAAGMRVVAIASAHAAEGRSEADYVLPRLADLDLQPTQDGFVIRLPGAR